MCFKHPRERGFRDWYSNLVDQVDWTPDQGVGAYRKWAAVLNTPEPVTGYREVRYPKMEAARRRAEELQAIAPEKFEAAPPTPPKPGGIALPILTTAQA